MSRTLQQRFDEKWSPDPSGCWIWNAARYGSGYGVLRVNNRNHHAHRISWMLHRGEIPGDLHVLHRCDVRPCVNPDHLFLGTNLDNIRDRDAKDRVAKGEKSGQAKLSNSDVIEIRDLLAQGLGYRKLGERFGVDFSAIYKIAKRKRWKHLVC